jgi:hypothetical protein
MTTENCFKQMTRLSTRLSGKNSTDGSPYGSFHQTFFHCNISPKSAIFPMSGQTAPILGSTLLNDNRKVILP